MTTLQPETEAGLGLRGALRKPRTMPDTEVDWSKWIVEIERQAKAALVGRLISAFEHEQCAGSHRGYCTGVLVSHDRIADILAASCEIGTLARRIEQRTPSVAGNDSDDPREWTDEYAAEYARAVAADQGEVWTDEQVAKFIAARRARWLLHRATKEPTDG